MKHALSLILTFAAAAIFGNAGVFRGSGQSVVLDSTAQIQMAEEVVTMMPMRGNYPVDTSCRNMDPMKFHCVFKLRNLTDRTVTVPVGFPISNQALRLPDHSKINQAELIATYGFVAGTKDRTYPIRYVPFDKNRKFSNIFLWDMTFRPNEEIELLVCYTMHGYLGLASTRKGNKPWENCYRHSYLSTLESAAGEGQMYVTETGKSWAGKIEKATFRIIPFDFEEYLTRRGAFEETPEKKKSETDIQLALLKTAPMVRKWSPEYEKWNLVKDKRGRNLHLELVYAPFDPGDVGGTLNFFYVFPGIPTTAEQFELLLAKVRKEMEAEYARRDEMLQFWADAKKNKTHPEKQIQMATAHWQGVVPYSSAVERNLADAVLEFYGIRRNNPEIGDFLEIQCWYPAAPRPIDPALKNRLEK